MFPYICKVKKKLILINFTLMIVVLFSILFQSIHSYEHFSKELSQEICHHKYHLHKTEFSHQHNNFEHCFVCHFSVSSFVASDIHHYEFQKVSFSTGYFFFKSRQITQFFKGSLFALRAPPIFIV